VNDKIGKILEKKRIEAVWPYISGRLLDIGCGMNHLVRKYKNGIGIDVYDWGDVDTVVENSAQLPFKDSEFDTVTIIAALNHIPNRKDVLWECSRVLNDNGRLIITMIPPLISAIWHKIRKPWDIDQKERGMEEDEVFGFTSKELLRIVNGNGFETVLQKRFMAGINSVYVFKKDK
jgi:ubiquinone/menaquinone biosynthesis C-methylase UbiE